MDERGINILKLRYIASGVAELLNQLTNQEDFFQTFPICVVLLKLQNTPAMCYVCITSSAAVHVLFQRAQMI